MLTPVCPQCSARSISSSRSLSFLSGPPRPGTASADISLQTALRHDRGSKFSNCQITRFSNLIIILRSDAELQEDITDTLPAIHCPASAAVAACAAACQWEVFVFDIQQYRVCTRSVRQCGLQPGCAAFRYQFLGGRCHLLSRPDHAARCGRVAGRKRDYWPHSRDPSQCLEAASGQGSNYRTWLISI